MQAVTTTHTYKFGDGDLDFTLNASGDTLDLPAGEYKQAYKLDVQEGQGTIFGRGSSEAPQFAEGFAGMRFVSDAAAAQATGGSSSALPRTDSSPNSRRATSRSSTSSRARPALAPRRTARAAVPSSSRTATRSRRATSSGWKSAPTARSPSTTPRARRRPSSRATRSNGRPETHSGINL